MPVLLDDSTAAALQAMMEDHARLARKVDSFTAPHLINDRNAMAIGTAPAQLPADVQPLSFPVGQYQFQVYAVVSQNQAGFDFVRAHSILT